MKRKTKRRLILFVIWIGAASGVLWYFYRLGRFDEARRFVDEITKPRQPPPIESRIR